MRTLKHNLLLAMVLIVFISCSSDDDSGNENDNPADIAELILGSWTFSNSTTNGVADPVDDPCEQLLSINFSANLNFTRFERSGDNCQTTTQFTGTYSLNGNTLTVTTGQGTNIVEITNISSSNVSFQHMDGSDVIVENFTK
ncbi:lipocalin family protein [Winogradskyella sp.]|uniref:lipocalin family protein n=1 Tax=Winogradskyella sp. TaxID=1883156 RepID=UPI00260EEE17|nr:lipocalin family protein [Winogradskyella sp.]